jgi:hypothetical protein
MAVPRIITADSTGTIARIVRSAIDLLELSVIHIDVPTATDALEEAKRANLAVTAFELDEDMKGFEFALRVKRDSPETSVIILGEEHDPGEFDEETAIDSPFIYMSRPVDIHKFLRVLIAGMESHEAMVEALIAPATGGGSIAPADMGPVPEIDLSKAQPILDSLLRDLGAMAIILATRTGETLSERGAFGYIDRDQLARAIMPTMVTNIDVRDLVGGDVSSVQFYDGDNYDVFVLTAGLHHFLCIMFEGQQGRSQFGMVTRYGRGAVQDLIALLGANAFFVQAPVSKAPEPPKRKPVKRPTEEVEIPVLASAFEVEEEEEVEEEPEPALQLEAIPDEEFDPDALFGEDVEFDEDLFSEENVEALAKQQEEQERKGTLDWDQAEQLGVLKS